MFKRLWEWIKRPHGWALLLLHIFTAIFIAGAIVFSFIGQGTSYIFIAYIFYGFAAASLCYTVYTIIIFVPLIKRIITEKLKSNKFTAKVFESYDVKTTVFALLSFGITIVFATINLVSSIHFRLFWYGTIAAYYFVLIIFRGGILFAYKKCAEKFSDSEEKYEKSKLHIYLASGAFLILLEFAMIGAVTQMMLSERPVQSSEILAIINAAYTFYKITMAIYNLVKARRSSNPVIRSLRSLNFADACMSVISLTVLMLSTFGVDNPTSSMNYVKYIVGFIGCAVIIIMAAFIIIRANKQIKLIKRGNENEQ